MHIGGAEQAVCHLARGLDRLRFQVAVCCTRELGVLAEQLRAESIDVMLAAPSDPRHRYLTPLYVRRMVREYAADVVHTHGTPTMFHTGPLAPFGQLPRWIHTYHYGNYPLPSPRHMLAERIMSRWPEQLVAVSDAQRRALIEYHRIPPERIVTIVNGVTHNPHLQNPAVRAARRAEFGFGPDDVVAGCVAVLGKQKGIPFLLQAAAQLLPRHPRLKFLVAGGGPLEAALRAEAEALGLGGRVVFTGWRQDNLEILTALDIFIMSSLWEAMPLALLEAMAARRPIVVTDVGDNRDVVENGRCARIVPPGNAAAIAEAVEALLGDSAETAAMAGRAFARFESRFTVAHMLAAYERLYEPQRRERGAA